MFLGFLFIIVRGINHVCAGKEANISTTISHRKCFVVAENDIFSMVNYPVAGKCNGFICWESNLLLINKAKITWMYNSFREQIAESEVINSMTKLNWHWTLENEALKIISECPAPQLKINSPKRHIQGLDDFLTCEYSVAVHVSPTTSQDNFVEKFPQFLKNNSLHDFDEHHKFRRTSALYFGCALSVVNADSTNMKSYFTCIYCSKEESLANEFDDCVSNTKKNGNLSEFRNLCAATKYLDLYGCEPKNICYPPLPDSWKSGFPGTVEQVYAINSGKKTWLAINRSSTHLSNAERAKQENKLILYTKESENWWFFNYLPLPEYSYSYNEEIMNKLNTLVEKSYTKGSTRTKRQTQKVSNDPQVASSPSYEDYYPKCCTYLLILNLLLLIGILVLIYYTYEHYKKTHSKT